MQAWIIGLRTLLGAAETRERALHGLWELACRPSNHVEISVEIVDEIVGVMRNATREPAERLIDASGGLALVPDQFSPEFNFRTRGQAFEGLISAECADQEKGEELRVGAMAALALWMLAEVETTRQRLPVAQYVPLLLEFAHRAASSQASPDLAMAPVGALAKLIAMPAALAVRARAIFLMHGLRIVAIVRMGHHTVHACFYMSSRARFIAPLAPPIAPLHSPLQCTPPCTPLHPSYTVASP